MTGVRSITKIKDMSCDINTIQDIVSTYNQQLADAFYISTTFDLPSRKDMAHCYRLGSDFSLKTKEESQSLWCDNIVGTKGNQQSDFFVYNERTKELVPFQKHDCLMCDTGYFTYDGKDYVSYDDGGNEIQRFTFDHNHKIII